MLLKVRTVDAIFSGEVTRVYRRWATPRAKAGGRQRTHRGELAIDAVTEVALPSLTEADARAAGHDSLAALRGELEKREGRVFRVDLRVAGPDPRVALREQASLTPGDRVALAKALARKERGGPWTEATLRLIAAHPGTRAGDLAPQVGMETPTFKRRVRQLKELGLTESLEVGYRVSPRGRAFLDGRD